MRHGVVLSLCEPAALEDKGAAAAICRGTGKPCLPARAQQPCPPLPALLPALSPQPSLTRLLACSLGRLTAQPVLDASWAAVSPTACDTATPNVPPAVMWAPHHCGEPGLMEGPALGCLGKKGHRSSALLNAVGWTNPITQAHGENGPHGEPAVTPVCVGTAS